MADLISPKSDICDIAVASITITSERQNSGVLFAYPYYASFVAIMVKTGTGSVSGWSFFKPFSTDLWVAIAVTLLLWPTTIYFVEAFSMKPQIKTKNALLGVEEATWRALWTIQHGETLAVSSLGARIAVICFAFMALIVGSSYTANLAAFLTVQKVNNQITSVYDLPGLAVASVPVYIPRLRSQYGIIASDANITDIQSVKDTAGLVAGGNLAAFLYDDVVSAYVTATFPGCAVRLLPDKIQPFDYGIAFTKGFDPNLVDQISAGVLEVQESGFITQLEARYLLESSPCLTGASASSIDSNQLSFQAVYGLWVILGAGLVAGACCMLVVRWKKKKMWAVHAIEEENRKNGGWSANGSGGASTERKFVHLRSDLDAVESDIFPDGDAM